MPAEDRHQAKHWCITENNYVVELNQEPCLKYDEEHMQYLICGIEVGEGGTPHLQGYVQFKKRKSLNQVKQFFPRAHLEKMRGKPDQAKDYCMKDGVYHEHGTFLKGAGTRNDLNEIKKLIDEGHKLDKIRELHYGTLIRYERAIIRDIERCLPLRTEPPEVFIYWGSTGTGKSKKAFDENPGAYWKDRGDWWDGYDGEECAIIDEFYGWLPLDFVLRLCDRYPMRLPVKGAFKQCRIRKIIFTSNKPWTEWWSNLRMDSKNDQLFAAFERRITQVVHFSSFDSLGRSSES